MKKTIIAVLVLGIILTAGFMLYDNAGKPGNTDGVKYSTIHKSELFSDKEINAAIEAVKRKFRDFEGCTLTEIYYDEEKSKSFAEGYSRASEENECGMQAENVIVLLSSFTVDESGGDGSLNAGGNYTGWNWILIREEKNSRWEVYDWGY